MHQVHGRDVHDDDLDREPKRLGKIGFIVERHAPERRRGGLKVQEPDVDIAIGALGSSSATTEQVDRTNIRAISEVLGQSLLDALA
jgi:hypothetical protein